MYTSGHGAHWQSVTAYVRNNVTVWRQALST